MLSFIGLEMFFVCVFERVAGFVVFVGLGGGFAGHFHPEEQRA